MIHLDHVSVTYAEQSTPALVTGDRRIGEGELVLVAGATGSGKSTLLTYLNGLVPHFTGGTLSGHVVVDGRDTREYRPQDLADVVGLARQNPAASFVTDTVEDEIAYGMEALGVPPSLLRRRVEEALDLLGLAPVRRRILVEHGRAADPVPPADAMARSRVYPPVIALGRYAGWEPLPLSVRAARRVAGPLRKRLTPAPLEADSRRETDAHTGSAGPRPWPWSALAGLAEPRRAAELGSAQDVLGILSGVNVRRGALPAPREVDLTVWRGEIVALMGRNGAGKSTMLWTLAGQLRTEVGTVRIGRDAPAALPPHRRTRLVGMVPQDPAHLLYGDTVAQECADADAEAGVPDSGQAGALLRRIAGRWPASRSWRPPRDQAPGGPHSRTRDPAPRRTTRRRRNRAGGALALAGHRGAGTGHGGGHGGRQTGRDPWSGRGARRRPAGAVRRDGRPGTVVRGDHPGRAGPRAPDGVPDRGAGAARRGVPDRRGRCVDRVPDDRLRVGRPGRRAAPPGPLASGRGVAARRVRARRRPAVRPGDEPVVLAVPGDGCRPTGGGRSSRAASCPRPCRTTRCST